MLTSDDTGFTNSVYWITCCPGEPHLPYFSFQCLRVAGICFSDALSMNRAVQKAKGSLTDKQGNIQGTLKVMKSKVIPDKLWNIRP